MLFGAAFRVTYVPAKPLATPVGSARESETLPHLIHQAFGGVARRKFKVSKVFLFRTRAVDFDARRESKPVAQAAPIGAHILPEGSDGAAFFLDFLIQRH